MGYSDQDESLDAVKAKIGVKKIRAYDQDEVFDNLMGWSKLSFLEPTPAVLSMVNTVPVSLANPETQPNLVEDNNPNQDPDTVKAKSGVKKIWGLRL